MDKWIDTLEIADVNDFMRYCAYGRYFCVLQTKDRFFVYGEADEIIFWCHKEIDTTGKTLVAFNFETNDWELLEKPTGNLNDIHKKRYLTLVTLADKKPLIHYADRNEFYKQVK